MWEEIDTAAKLHKLISEDPTTLPARDSLRMATIEGARAIHLDREIGSLEVGKRADLIIVDLGAPHLVPLYNLYSHLVYATKAGDVTDTVVDGRVLMRSRRLLTIDEGATIARAREYQLQVMKSLK
jgi:5-methylthioadenosine/S-adenosylhomocysteine deaminase